jgi:hypothetical protein
MLFEENKGSRRRQMFSKRTKVLEVDKGSLDVLWHSSKSQKKLYNFHPEKALG